MYFNHIAIIGKYQDSTPNHEASHHGLGTYHNDHNLDCVNGGNEGINNHILDLTQHLIGLGIHVYIENKLPTTIKNSNLLSYGEISDWLGLLDLVIVIGGDGTFLSIARLIVNHKIPIIGINSGKLGFMTDIPINKMLKTLDSIIIEGKFYIENRSLLEAKVLRNNQQIYTTVALNDIVIARGAIGHMIEFEISINNQFVFSQKSDGVIFATPTGSTAYSLAAGGAILQPDAGVFSIVPICPQSLTNRPLVISDSSIIELILVRENATQIHGDGQECFDLMFHDKVILNKNNQQLKLIHYIGYSYYSTLRQKLDWSKRVS